VRELTDSVVLIIKGRLIAVLFVWFDAGLGEILRRLRRQLPWEGRLGAGMCSVFLQECGACRAEGEGHAGTGTEDGLHLGLKSLQQIRGDEGEDGAGEAAAVDAEGAAFAEYMRAQGQSQRDALMGCCP